MSEFQKESLSLAETNKLRIKLGLKPLVDDAADAAAPPASNDDTATAAAADSLTKSARQVDEDADVDQRHRQWLADNKRKQDEDAIKQRIAKAQNKRELARKLQGPTLADPEPEAGPSSSSAAAAAAPQGTDTLKWLKQAKKRAKDNAAKRARELQEQEAQAQQEYGDADLEGLKVAHDLEDFDEGDEHILTLRDAGVLEDKDDELMDLTLDQAERDRLNQERKKGRRDYTGLDDDQFASENIGKRRSVLSKYDADIGDDGLTRSDEGGFRLGAGARPAAASTRSEQARRELERDAAAANKQLLSLDYAKNQEVSDYLQEGDVGFKKPKTKKRKKAARVKLDLDEPDEGSGGRSGPAALSAPADADVQMDDEPAIATRKPRGSGDVENFVDDDELQASLAKARRQKAKRTFVKMTPEMIAKNLAAQRAAEEAERAASGSPYPGDGSATPGTNGVAHEESGHANGLTFDNTSEFIRAIGHRQAAEQAEEAERRRRAAIKQESASAEPEPRAGPSSQPNGSAAVKVEDGDVDFTDAAEEYEAARVAAEGPGSPAARADGSASPTPAGVPEIEPTVGMGMAGTLAILRNQGMLPTVSSEEKAREKQQKEYDRWMAQRRAEEQLRELERKASKAQGAAKDQATREYENRKRELDEARSAQDRFREYKPDVDIKYHDEFGRELNAHEAWKQLSHVFHGKKPGAKKIEKRLKKIEDEKKRERMVAGDTPTGMLAAFQNRAERTGQAHMVLSVGSRGSAPSDLELLGPNTLYPASSHAGSKGKKKANPAVGGSNGEEREGGSRSTSVTAMDDASVLSSVAPAGGEASVTTARRGWSTLGGGGGGGASRTFSPVVSGSAGKDSPATSREEAAPASQPFRISLGGGSGGVAGTKRKAEEGGS